jgi:hypothetical protein
MTHESKSIIDFILTEIRILRGEITIAKSLYQINDEIPEPKSIAELVDIAQDFGEFMKIINYNEGKYQAYINILKQIGLDITEIKKI